MGSGFTVIKVIAWSGTSRTQPADNRDGADVLMRMPTQILRQAKIRFAELALTRTSKQLQIHFIDHAQSRRADRVK